MASSPPADFSLCQRATGDRFLDRLEGMIRLLSAS